MSDATAALASIGVARDALDEATQRQRVAIDAVVDFALRAVLDGHDLEPIMEACGFRDDGPATGLAALVSYQGAAKGRFALWIGNALCERVVRATREGGG